MWLLPKGRRDPEQVGKRIPDELANLLVGEHAGTNIGPEAPRIGRLLRYAHLHGQWIACDCRQQQRRYPLMCPVYQVGTDTFHLRNLNAEGRPLHSIACPFRIERGTRGDAGGKADTTLTPMTGRIQLLRGNASERAALAEGGGKSDGETTRSASFPSLRRLLLTLLEAADAHRLPPTLQDGEHDIADQLKRLRTAASGLTLERSVMLSSMLCTYVKDFESRRFFARMRDIGRSEGWPPRRPLEGFVVTYAEEVGERWIKPKYGANRIETVGRVGMPEIHGRGIGGPYAVITHIGETGRSQGLEALKAWAEPVYWGTLSPVDSSLERDVWKALKRVRYRTLEKGDVSAFSITKPLFDIGTGIGPCRPDFLVETSRDGIYTKRTVIEVMGLADADYLDRKRRTHDRMTTLGNLVTIGQNDIRNSQLDQLLGARVL